MSMLQGHLNPQTCGLKSRMASYLIERFGRLRDKIGAMCLLYSAIIDQA